jgi:integrase
MIMGADAETQDWFWGPRRGGSGENRGLTTSAINRIVTTRSMELIKDEDGKPKRVTGHSRRHAVATMWAEEAPEQVANVSLLLQQADPRSREIYSMKAKKVMARIAAECLAELRKAAKVSSRTSGGTRC